MKAKLKRPRSENRSNDKVQRISVSLPVSIFNELDLMVAERGLESRSKAIAEMVTQFGVQHREDKGVDVMAGTITIVYDEGKGNFLQRLAQLERHFVDEVISSLHVQLENNHRMEVLLVQGPVNRLRMIADQLVALKGVRTGKLTLTSMIMPPLHQHPHGRPLTKSSPQAVQR
jgi:CopG family transcriptional regulator, nickel-responsive regulator